jgi:hypothetical protein
MSLKDQIQSAQDLKSEPVEVPEWGCQVYIKTMNGIERDKWEALAYSAPGTRKVIDEYWESLLLHTIVDENGERVFSDSDLGILRGKSSKVIGRLFDKAAKQNGIRKEDLDTSIKNS